MGMGYRSGYGSGVQEWGVGMGYRSEYGNGVLEQGQEWGTGMGYQSGNGNGVWQWGRGVGYKNGVLQQGQEWGMGMGYENGTPERGAGAGYRSRVCLRAMSRGTGMAVTPGTRGSGGQGHMLGEQWVTAQSTEISAVVQGNNAAILSLSSACWCKTHHSSLCYRDLHLGKNATQIKQKSGLWNSTYFITYFNITYTSVSLKKARSIKSNMHRLFKCTL